MTYLVLNVDSRTVAREFDQLFAAQHWIIGTRLYQQGIGLWPTRYRVIPVGWER